MSECAEESSQDIDPFFNGFFPIEYITKNARKDYHPIRDCIYIPNNLKFNWHALRHGDKLPRDVDGVSILQRKEYSYETINP